MTIKEEFKILRTELSKKPETKTVPEFIIEGLAKLGYRTDDLQTPKQRAQLRFAGMSI